MDGYLGQTKVDIKKSRFKKYTKQDWAMAYIESYGGTDGDHHKAWVLDQVARILKGTPVVLEKHKWKNGHEEMEFSTGEPSKKYLDWVVEMKDGEDGPESYGYDEGIAP